MMTTHKKKLATTTPQHLLLGSSIGAASLAFILGLFSTSKCQFVSTSFSLRFSGDGVFDDNNDLLADDATTNLIQLSLGLFRHQQFGVDNGMFHVDNTCTSYATTAIAVDTNWMAARTFGILALIIGGIHLLLLLLVGVCIHSRSSSSYEKMKRIMKIISPNVYLLCCLFQGLTLLILNSQLCNNSNNSNNTIRQSVERLLARATIQWSENGCTMESGSKMATSSVVFWLVAGILSFLSNHFMNRMTTTTVWDDLPDASSTAKNKVRNDCIREDERKDNDGNESQTRGGVQVHSSTKNNNNDDDDCQDQDEEAISPITTLKTTNSVGSKQQEQQAASSISSTPKQSSPSTNNPSSSSIITAPPRLGISSNNNATSTEKSNNLSPSIVSRNNMSVSSSPRVVQSSSSSSSVKGSYSPAGEGRRRARYR